MSAVRTLSRRGPLVLVCALSFLAGGLLLPQIGSATVSTGERDAFFPLPPARVLDTRVGPTPLTPGTKVGPGQTINVQMTGVGGVPATASAVVLNVTVTNPSSPSVLTVFPTGTAKPTASSLNFAANETIPNHVTAKLGTGGKVSIFNELGNVDVIADVNGYYEDHNFDDRYDTKAQSDAKIATAITTPDHVAGAQVANDSLTGADVLDGSLKFRDLAGGTPFLVENLGNFTLPGLGCAVFSVSDSGNQFQMIVPMRIGLGIPTSASLGGSPGILNNSGRATINICNSSTTTFTGTSVIMEYVRI